MGTEQRLAIREDFLAGADIQRGRPDANGAITLRPVPRAELQVAVDELRERWAQRYVTEHHRQLGFAKVRGPYGQGPDFEVYYKKKWHWAEVETRWQNYIKHQHHLSPAFRETKYLILLNTVNPPAAARGKLPPEVVHIDPEHFRKWYPAASLAERIAERNSHRIDILAGEMQDHWVTICSDKDRDMAVCPDCDSCPYFGEGIGGEAGPHFQKLAAPFMARFALTETLEANLKKVREEDLQRFVEINPPI